jgi:hypothetical protein
MASIETNDNDRNPNGFYLIYDKTNNRDIDQLSSMIPNCIYMNSLPHKEDKKDIDKMFMMVAPKEFYDNNSAEELLTNYNIVIRRYRPPLNDKLKEGTTYGFYITSDGDYAKFSSALNSMFELFKTTKLIEEDSYEIIYPKPYPDGGMRKYAIVSFKKNDKGIYPRSYIRKLKILLNNSNFKDINFKVDWLSVNVMRDIKKGHSKDKKEKVTQMVTVSS